MNVRHCSYLLVTIIFGHISNLRIWIAKSEFFGQISVHEMWARQNFWASKKLVTGPNGIMVAQKF